MTPRVTPVEFTTEEARVLLSLLDIAVKAAGLQVAEAVAVLSKKIAPAAADTQSNEQLNLVE